VALFLFLELAAAVVVVAVLQMDCQAVQAVAHIEPILLEQEMQVLILQ
jgi:hypothetical protein